MKPGTDASRGFRIPNDRTTVDGVARLSLSLSLLRRIFIHPSTLTHWRILTSRSCVYTIAKIGSTIDTAGLKYGRTVAKNDDNKKRLKEEEYRIAMVGFKNKIKKTVFEKSTECFLLFKVTHWGCQFSAKRLRNMSTDGSDAVIVK